MVEMSLKMDDLSIYTMQSIQEAPYLIESINPDVIVLDLKTAALGDYQDFFHELKENDKTSAIPLVGLGKTEDVIPLGDLKKYFSGFLEKPLSPTNLAEKIRSAIGPTLC